MTQGRRLILWAKRIDTSSPSPVEAEYNYIGDEAAKGDWFDCNIPFTGTKADLVVLQEKYINTEFKLERERDYLWKDRESRRFADNTYKKLPDLWNELTPIDGHFCHLSNGKGGDLIAYTQDEDKGQLDIQTPLKAGKYIKKFYPDMSDQKVRQYTSAVQAVGYDLKFAVTPEDFCRVYENGPASCMLGTKWAWKTMPESKFDVMPSHTAAAYAGGDLQLAYLGDIDKAISRGLVWPEKKTFSYLYGNIPLLQAALEAQGYKKDPDYSPFTGARFKTIRYDETRIVMPYIDSISQLTYCDGQIYFGNISKTPEMKGKSPLVFNTSRNLGLAIFHDPSIPYCGLSNRVVTEKEDLVVLDEGIKAIKDVAIKAGYQLTAEDHYSRRPLKEKRGTEIILHDCNFTDPSLVMMNGYFVPKAECLEIHTNYGERYYEHGKHINYVEFDNKKWDNAYSIIGKNVDFKTTEPITDDVRAYATEFTTCYWGRRANYAEAACNIFASMKLPVAELRKKFPLYGRGY